MSPVVTRASDGVPVVAYAMLDEQGRTLASRNPRSLFYAASTVKLGVMLAAAIAAERGELSLDDTLQCRREFECMDADSTRRAFRLDPEDCDALFPTDGERATIRELVAMMITRSSNEATNVLFDRLGPAPIAEAFRLCCAQDTRMERRIGDPCAIRAGLTNESTPADLAAVLRRIVGGGLTSDTTADWMRRVLEAQEHARIGSVVPNGTPWGSKSGDVPGVEHDVAFVGPAGSRQFLAVCTRGYEPEQGREVIRAVAEALLSTGSTVNLASSDPEAASFRPIGGPETPKGGTTKWHTHTTQISAPAPETLHPRGADVDGGPHWHCPQR